MSDTVVAESLLINYGGMAAVNTASVVIYERDVKACCPDAWSMVNRASHSMLKLTSPCQILELEVIVSSINSSSIKLISWSGPLLFLFLQTRFLYICKQELTRKPDFLVIFLRYKGFSASCQIFSVCSSYSSWGFMSCSLWPSSSPA